MSALRSYAAALGGVISGNQVCFPGPGHSARDRSCTLRLSGSAPDGFVVFSHAGDDWRVVHDHVRRTLGMQQISTVETAGRVPDDAQRRERARQLWYEGVEPRGTPVERYLALRRLNLSDDIAGPVLRYHPRCPWRDEGGVLRVPAMLALYRSIASDEIVGVQRTRLSPEGVKIERRMLGNCRDGAVKFDGDENVTTGLTIGEGAETVMTARQHHLRPAWALGSVGAIARFPVLAAIESLTLLAETGGASTHAVDECGARWHAADREVIVIRSRYGSDLNDAVRELAA